MLFFYSSHDKKIWLIIIKSYNMLGKFYFLILIAIATSQVSAGTPELEKNSSRKLLAAVVGAAVYTANLEVEIPMASDLVRYGSAAYAFNNAVELLANSGHCVLEKIGQFRFQDTTSAAGLK